MKRQIKFKALNKKGEWIYGMPTYDFKYLFDDSNVNSPDNYEIDSETLCQFTGLKDKNGVEIYEGDIAEVFDICGNPLDRYKDGVYKVIFETCQFLLDDVNSNKGMELFQEGCEMRVVGNTYKNK